jgi:hypothetical protein
MGIADLSSQCRWYRFRIAAKHMIYLAIMDASAYPLIDPAAGRRRPKHAVRVGSLCRNVSISTGKPCQEKLTTVAARFFALQG